MCGIYGYLDTSTTGISNSDWPMIYAMAKMTELRGEHSSGIMALSDDLKIGTFKTVGGSYWLWNTKGYDRFEKKFIEKGRFLIGHGRYATVGKVNKQNAHPFQEDHITLVHNGTIRDGVEMKGQVEVDSHALCHLIAEKGLKEAMGTIQGAWAICAYDSNEQKLNILRNYERDLHYAKTSFGVFIMSEKDALEYLLRRGKNYTEVKPFVANKLYTFDVKTKTFTEEGEHIAGRQNYHQGNTWAGGMYGSGSVMGKSYGGSSGSATTNKYTKKTYEVPPIIDAKAAVLQMEQVYEVGDMVEITVRDYTIVNGVFHFKAFDDKGNEFRFTTGNLGAAQLVKAGDTGIGEVIGVGLDYVSKTTTYRCRFRDIVWNHHGVKSDEASTLVTTRGGDSVEREEWERICREEQCFSCTGRLDPARPTEAVLVDSKRVFCADCVDDYCNHGHTLGVAFPDDLRRIIQ